MSTIHLSVLLLIFDLTSTKIQNTNVLIFIANDLGYGDLSCYGNELIKTPNIDKLAETGLKLNRMYSMPSDAGSMSAIFSGQHPLRIGLVKGNLGWSNFWTVAQPGGMEFWGMNIGKFFEMRHISSFLLGRWDIGSWPAYLPTNQGFHGFYGSVMGHNPGCSSVEEDRFTDADYFNLIMDNNKHCIITYIFVILTLNFLSLIRIKLILFLMVVLITILCTIRLYCWLLPLNNSTCRVFENSVVKEHVYNDKTLTQITTEKAKNFLKYRKSKPFLLVVSYHQPGFPAFTSQHFNTKSGTNKYYDSILEIDWSIGQIMDTLREKKLENNTIVIFLSDNGPVLTNPYTGLPLKHSSTSTVFKGEKFSLMEGGLRVPAIISWPTHIPFKQETSVVTSLMDIFPTVVSLMGGFTQFEKLHISNFDGKDLSSLFKSPHKKSDVMHKALLHYCEIGNLAAATVGDYKIYFISHNTSNDCSGKQLDKPLIYNVVTDPKEDIPLAVTLHQDKIYTALAAAATFEISFDIKKNYLTSQFDQIPLPWFMWTKSKI